MKILFSGASGFIGKSILPIITKTFEVSTLGLTINDTYRVDISKKDFSIDSYFDYIIHAAGKAHAIPKTAEEEKLFFDINLQGTKNLCAGLEKSGLPKSFIFISTVAVYGCETGVNITEEHPLNGDTPYALSKIQTEQFLICWAKKNNVILTILRPSLIAGVNPPGNLGDMIKGIQTGRYLSIGGGKARKSVLMAQDIANLIILAKDRGGIFNVCDDNHPSFRELEVVICEQLGKQRPMNIPYWIAKMMAFVGDCLGRKVPINSKKLNKITKSLTFSNAKAKTQLGWQPLSVIDNFRIR